MVKPVMELTCKKCRGLIEVYKDDLGRQGVCPVCGTPVQFPAARDLQPAKVKCLHCQALIDLPPGFKDEEIACPGCRRFTPVANAFSKDGGTGIFLNALGLKSSYWSLLLKACLYPVSGSLSLLTFLLGISAVIVATITLSKIGIGYALATFGEQQRQWIAVGMIVLAGTLFGMLALSYYCSLLIGLVRNTLWPGRRSPSLAGMDHRESLYRVLTWAAFYFGLAFLLAYVNAAAGELFFWTRPSIFILVLLGSLAPMGFLRSEAITNTAGYNLPQVLRNILAVPGEYFGFLVVTVLAGAIYVKIGNLLYARSRSFLSGCTLNYYLGIPLQILAVTALLSAFVMGARALGIFFEYHSERLAFQGGRRLPSEKLNLLLGILTLAAIGLIGYGLFIQTREYLFQLDRPSLALAKMMRIHRLTRGFYPNYPQNKAELFALLKAGGNLDYLQSQTLLPPRERYDLYPLKKSSPQGFLWIYETEPAGRQGNKVYVIRYGAEEGLEPIRAITVEKRDEILKLQAEYDAETDSEKRAALAARIAAAWPQISE